MSNWPAIGVFRDFGEGYVDLGKLGNVTRLPRDEMPVHGQPKASNEWTIRELPAIFIVRRSDIRIAQQNCFNENM